MSKTNINRNCNKSQAMGAEPERVRTMSHAPERVRTMNATPARIINWRVDTDGMLRVTARVLKAGVFAYGADESGTTQTLPGIDPVMQLIAASSFTDEALSSLEGKPVIIRAHEWRDAENTLEDGLTVGSVAGSPRVADGIYIECDFVLYDAGIAQAIQRGDLVEVSAGYEGQHDIRNGIFNGEAFHLEQKNLRFNHVLLLPEGQGRCGRDVRIINHQPEQGEHGRPH